MEVLSTKLKDKSLTDCAIWHMLAQRQAYCRGPGVYKREYNMEVLSTKLKDECLIDRLFLNSTEYPFF